MSHCRSVIYIEQICLVTAGNSLERQKYLCTATWVARMQDVEVHIFQLPLAAAWKRHLLGTALPQTFLLFKVCLKNTFNGGSC